MIGVQRAAFGGSKLGAVAGTATNDSAITGNVGEFVTATVATGSAVSLTTTVAANVTSISLTAGDWDVAWTVDFKPGATTSVTLMQTSISLVSATHNTQAGGSGIGTEALTIFDTAANVLGGDFSEPGGPVRCSFSSTQTVFLVSSATFSISTMAAYGTIRARRVR